MTRLTSAARALVLAMCISGAGAGAAVAQQPQSQPRPTSPPAAEPSQAPSPPVPATAIAAFQDSQDANEIRQRLSELLRQYPPSVGQVFQLDPSLLTRPDYMAPYPALAVFLQQHPDVVRNPSFFFGESFLRGRDSADPRTRAVNVFGDVMLEAMVFTGLMAVLGVLTWLLRQLIDYRRWLRISKVQIDTHAKLLDRLTSNDELLTYIQSAPGRRFLESAPVLFEGEGRPIGAPIGRILWSVQGGVVLAMLGGGLGFVQRSANEELAQGFYFLSVITVALGLGFILSALVSYILSVRLGLFALPKPSINE